MLLALDLENLPDLPATAVPWLFAGLLLAWLALRVHFLRRRLAAMDAGDPPPPASPVLLALARSRAALPLLLVLVAGCALAVVLASR